MPEQLGGESIVESTGLVQRPQSVQGGPAGFGLDLFSQLGIGHGGGAVAQQAHGGLPVPLVWVRQKPDELPVGFCAEIGVGDEWLGLGSEPVNAAGGGVDLALVMLAVRDVALIKIGDEQRAVGGVGHVNRPEGDVGILHREADVARGE